MPTLVVKLKIPFECEPLAGANPALTFSHWLPIGDQHAIHVVQNAINLSLWFDEQSTWRVSQPTAEELKNCVNVPAHYVNADVNVAEIPVDIASYMQGRDFSRLPNESEQPLQLAYERIGHQVLSFVLTSVNRLVAFARAKKGQYWLTEFEFDEGRMQSLFNQFEARACVDDGPSFRFQPATTAQTTVSFASDGRYITEAEWPEFQDFVQGTHRSSLTGELLAGAEHLWKVGHRRSALIQAVTVLEITLHDFAKNPKADAAFGSRMAERLGVPTLHSQVEHMGLSGCVRYLLPTILPEDVMPNDVLRECQAALTQRQNVVHNGQRDVSEETTRKALVNIRRFCEILESLTGHACD